MADEFDATIATLKSHLQKQEEEVRSTKRLINQLCQRGGNPIQYPEAEGDSHSSAGPLRRDQFYGVPLATAIKKVLEMRRSTGPSTVNSIYTALIAGGFKFSAKSEVNAKRSLYISLAKNYQSFHKLPGTTEDGAVFGLLEWYPNAKSVDEPKKAKKNKKGKRSFKWPKSAAEKNGVPVEQKTVADHPHKDEAGKKPEKGSPREEIRSAESAARKKHNPATVA